MLPYTLVVCEKPDAARRIAYALGAAKETQTAGLPVFDVRFGGRHYRVCSASGHLYGISDPTNNRSVYPVLDLEWAPIDAKGKATRVKRTIDNITRISYGADQFVHACDYDQEGEVIGQTILEYACLGKYEESLRAKFSTLTDGEVRDAFGNLQNPNKGLAEAGRSRHMLDFLYGINLSRALTQSFKAGNKGYRNLSIGRVQGPTLAFVTDREREIMLHVPDPYWGLKANFDKNGQVIHARYEKPKVETLAEAQEIFSACTGKGGTVRNVDYKKMMLRPPTPFNIGDLQREAYRLFRMSPGCTLAIAEKLYLQALISYPRTSSQKLPTSINYRKILSGLAGNGYNNLASVLLSKDRLTPNEGATTDSAHPAIYPTGEARRLSGLELRVYDLIAKRFLATFGDAAVMQRTEVFIDVQGHVFVAEGRVTLYDGWMIFYKPHVNFEQSAMPELRLQDELENKKVAMEEKFTQPPWRYNQASLLAKMEEERIGTKATRADTVATLLKRSYIAVKHGGLEVTDLGFAVLESMRKHIPEIVSINLTRSMEEQLDKIEQGVQDSASVIEYAVDQLLEGLETFRGRQLEIGQKIGSAAKQANLVVLGQCPICRSGRMRMIRSSITKKRFVGCSNYSSGCKASAPLPQKGTIKTTTKSCHCGWPMISVVFGRNRKWNMCVSVQCPYKKQKEPC